jgi:hypothetical protein
MLAIAEKYLCDLEIYMVEVLDQQLLFEVLDQQLLFSTWRLRRPPPCASSSGLGSSMLN